MATGNVMSFAYPDAGLAFRGDGKLSVIGLAYRDVVRNGKQIRSMPRSMSLQLIDPDGKVMGIKSFATRSLFMLEFPCYFFCIFDMERELASNQRPDGDWTLKLTGDFRAEDGSMSQSKIDRKIRIVMPKEIPRQSVYPSWEPTPPKDGNFGLTWSRPQPGDVFAGLPIPVTFGGRRTVTGNYPVLELLDNANQVVVTSQWFNIWSRSSPQLRTTVKAPGDLDAARNTHQFRLSIIEPETPSRTAASYRSLQADGAGRPTILAAGAGGRGAAPGSFSTRSARSARTKPSDDNRVNLNKASAAEIAERLPGVGPALAKKIVAARPVKSLDQLIAIRGLSPLMVESIQGLVEF